MDGVTLCFNAVLTSKDILFESRTINYDDIYKIPRKGKYYYDVTLLALFEQRALLNVVNFAKCTLSQFA
jgi:hypothetical protein